MADEPCIEALIKSHRLVRVVTINQVPPWDLAVVLRYISLAPFEPIQDCSLKHLTVKSLFPFALALGKKEGGAQRLNACVFWVEQKQVCHYPEV